MEASQGDDVVMEVPLRHLQSPDIQWFKDDEPLESSSHLHFSERPNHCSLLIKFVTPRDTGIYKCVATSDQGSITKKFLVNIEGKAMFTLNWIGVLLTYGTLFSWRLWGVEKGSYQLGF